MENTGRNCEMIRRIRYTGPEDTEERNRTTMENTQNLLLDSRLKQMILIGPDPESIRPVPARLREKIICISVEESEEHTAEAEIKKINLKLPAYISVDKDVLNRYNARTNWNQGNMSVTTLKKLLREVFRHQKVIGVDICGECSLQEPFPEFLEDERINDVTNQILYHFLSERRFLA